MTNSQARTSVCRGCNGALTWAGHYWIHDTTGARLCYAEREARPARCGAASGTYFCTLAAGHAGAHAAPVRFESTKTARWETSGPVRIFRSRVRIAGDK